MTKSLEKTVGDFFSQSQIDAIIFKAVLKLLINDHYRRAKLERDVAPEVFAKEFHIATLNAIGDTDITLSRPEIGLYSEIEDDILIDAEALIKESLGLEDAH